MQVGEVKNAGILLLKCRYYVGNPMELMPFALFPYKDHSLNELII